MQLTVSLRRESQPGARMAAMDGQSSHGGPDETDTFLRNEANKPVVFSKIFGDLFQIRRAFYLAPAASSPLPWIFRAANDSITRVMPLTIMLTPTRVPNAHNVLDGQ